MPIRYKLVQRKDFSKDAPTDGKRYYASLVSNGTVSLDELCESIAEETALTSADVKSILDRLPRILRRHLSEGRNVQMGEFGSIRPTLGSQGSLTKKEFNAATMMRKPGLVFTPGKLLQDMRENVTFLRVKDPDEEAAGDSESPDEI
ncbi:HU family DNA-binding protein [Parabacteroides timonensis]|uniref:HU family DNA-binding protein n=1 Tax=Parabacteroides timonensis TaxID=1871013 RepID=UPI00094F194D|nr:HU family DNA-binding protein [Parabacteroides timonensis]